MWEYIVRLEKSFKKKVKLYCIDRDITIAQFFREAVKEKLNAK